MVIYVVLCFVCSDSHRARLRVSIKKLSGWAKCLLEKYPLALRVGGVYKFRNTGF